MIPIDHRGGGGVAFIPGKAENGKLPASQLKGQQRIGVAKRSATVGHTSGVDASTKSLFLKILLLSDLFPRFCELKG